MTTEALTLARARARLARLRARRRVRGASRETQLVVRRVVRDGTRLTVQTVRGGLAMLDVAATKLLLDARDLRTLASALEAMARALDGDQPAARRRGGGAGPASE